jgi:hypothetical protein
VQWVTVYVTEGIRDLHPKAATLTKATKTLSAAAMALKVIKKMANDVWKGEKSGGSNDYLKNF